MTLRVKGSLSGQKIVFNMPFRVNNWYGSLQFRFADGSSEEINFESDELADAALDMIYCSYDDISPENARAYLERERLLLDEFKKHAAGEMTPDQVNEAIERNVSFIDTSEGNMSEADLKQFEALLEETDNNKAAKDIGEKPPKPVFPPPPFEIGDEEVPF